MGIIGQDGEQARTCLAGMAQRLAHRGPDDFGLFIDQPGQAALAHHRLSILDLSSAGHQPMTTEDGRWTITFNGEIYNYCELRDELAGLGVRFDSSSDTEVLLKGYRAWGRGVLDRLVGMFAFAIWDSQEQALFLARDRLGKKPLVYFTDGKVFAFGSELKALLEVPGCEARLDPDAVDLYLALGYVPAPHAIIRNVRKLSPGHWLTWRKQKLTLGRYWRPEAAESPTTCRDDSAERFGDLFRDAVRLRLRSDVPIGLFLSGGIDSSAIAAECAELGRSVDAFTVVFDRDDTDLPHGQAVARHFGLRHEVVEASGANIADDLQRVSHYFDEPFADSSSIPCWLVARQARRRFKVILTGDGGDEAFAGYPHYEFVGLKQFIKRCAAGAGLNDGCLRNAWSTYFQSKALFRRTPRKRLLEGRPQPGDGFSGYLSNEPFLKAGTPSDALHRALWADRHVYLPNDLLYKADIALMSQGIEGRSPFLDHRLMEWSQRLPSSQLVKGRSKKRLLKAAYRGRLPEAVLHRPKHGFGSPVRAWLSGPLRHLVKDYLPTPLLSGSMQTALMKRFAARPTVRHAQQLWTLLIFSLWARQWNATW